MSRIRLGEARTDDERAVETAIAALGLAGPDIAYARLAAGITNLNWLVHRGEETLFVKVFGRGTDSFIDRASAARASARAGELGIGPRLIAYLPQAGAEVFEFLAGYRTVTSEDLLDAGLRRRLLDAYRRMHQAGPIGLSRTGFDQFDERLRLAREHDAPLPADLDQLLWQCGRARSAILAAGMTTTLCHNDSYAANFMTDGTGGIRVIDWEYAADNDPCWDLAMLNMGGNGLASATTTVAGYAGQADPAMAARVLLYGAVLFVSWGIWAATQARLSTIAFDYRSYSRALFEFGRLKLRDPDWEAALWCL